MIKTTLLAIISLLLSCSPLHNPIICPNCPKPDGTVDKIICINDGFQVFIPAIEEGIRDVKIEKTKLIPQTISHEDNAFCNLTILPALSYEPWAVKFTEEGFYDKEQKTLWLFTDKFNTKEKISKIITVKLNSIVADNK